MKKLLSILLLTIGSTVTFTHTSFAMPKLEGSGYSITRIKQELTTIENLYERGKTYYESLEKLKDLGDPANWGSVVELAGKQVVSSSLLNAFQPTGSAKTAKEFPESDATDDFFNDHLFPPSGETGLTGNENNALTYSNMAKNQQKREKSIVELATYGYALSLINQEQAARNIGGKESTASKVTSELNQGKDYTTAIVKNSAATLNAAETYNRLMQVMSINSMLVSTGRSEDINPDRGIDITNALSGGGFGDLLGGMGSSLLGGSR